MHGLHSHNSLHSHSSHASQREGFCYTKERDGKADKVDGTLAASTSYSGRSSPGIEHPRRHHAEATYVPMGVSLPRSRSNSGSDAPPGRLFREPSDSKYAGAWEFATMPLSKVFVVLILLFLLPFMLDLFCSQDNGLQKLSFDPLARFKRNIHGQNIYRDSVGSRRMVVDPSKRVKAAIVVLARNKDLHDVLLSMQRMENSFNHKFNYPYVFLNNDIFEGEFKNRTGDATNARCLYGHIPEDQWSYPKWITPEEAALARKQMEANHVLYGNRESYHHMCRYFSGFIHKHPMLKEFDYYWRMEPDVHYYCDLDYDPFLFMQENQKKYSFVITIQELPKTIPTLWKHTMDFMRENKKLIPDDNLMQFVTAPDGSYNLCHFWSNFEIGDLNFFRSKPYQAYFDYLDRKGGFYFERWGDAPVHSLAVALFLSVQEVHFFQDIGYRHNSMKHCPATNRNNCACDALEAVRFHKPSFGTCHKRWDDLYGNTVVSRIPSAMP